jgi:hypothetical protein
MLSRVVVVSSVVCWKAVIVVPFSDRQAYDKKE